MNINHFEDLSSSMKTGLLTYIDEHYGFRKTLNTKYTAYTLKQQVTAHLNSADEHITSRCFMEAMVRQGYTAELCSKPGEPDNWVFNVSVPAKR